MATWVGLIVVVGFFVLLHWYSREQAKRLRVGQKVRITGKAMGADKTGTIVSMKRTIAAVQLDQAGITGGTFKHVKARHLEPIG